MEPLSEEWPHRGASPADGVSVAERAALLRGMVAELPERQRITLVLRIYEELSFREIGEAMDCPVGTAKANFFFALKNLRKRISLLREKP